MEVKFWIPGKPQGKARARTFKSGNVSHTVTPDKTVIYENFIKDRFLQNANGFYAEKGKSVDISVTAVFSPPRSASKKTRDLMLAGKLAPLKKPDLDNIIKVVCDALNGVAYHDDAQVLNIIAGKKYGEQDGVEVGVKYEG